MLRLTPHGLREMLIGSVLLALLAAGLGWIWLPLALLPLPVFVWLLAFFRDPERTVPTGPNLMVSPADGMVSDIEHLADHPSLGGPGVRVGIFLSVFNVHINRAPCDGVITSVVYKKGKFINALKHSDASTLNESNTITFADPATGQTCAVVRQIVGLIARTIVFPGKIGDSLTRGQRIGMIKFGSRTELYIPARLAPQVQVQIGQKVHGALTIIATITPA
jgi:phosphatidylserine decarboxylase